MQKYRIQKLFLIVLKSTHLIDGKKLTLILKLNSVKIALAATDSNNNI